MKLELDLSKLTLVGCGKLLQRQGADPKQFSLEELATSTLTSMVVWFNQRGWIRLPDTDEAIDAEFDQMFMEMAPQSGEDFKIDLFEAGQRVEDAVAAHKAEKQIESTKRSTEPTEVPDIQKPPKLDLSKVNRMDVDQLATLAPNDTLIQKVKKGVVPKEFRWALEVIYTSLAPELWGTPTAEQAIKDMLARHEVANG